ncbi:bifunctional diguanylate cyclase/phosphodiesterase [Stappia sp.]|uniref:putative bifunctional diguanylate cyclase/phosphodiesterase n=1 Tax=Stappia sp. TaxID=1870903 RepID=UPI0025F4A11D|nr:bifunctional diguanylate cyclase/phosphodiesterase [Stappia sp.]
MRQFRSLAGVLVGFLIVVAFAGAIHAANLLFSHALYSRDAVETAQRIAWELPNFGERGNIGAHTEEAPDTAPEAASDLAASLPADGTASVLRPSLDGTAPSVQEPVARASTPKTPSPHPSKSPVPDGPHAESLVAWVDDFAEHLTTHEDVNPLWVMVLSGSEPVEIARTDETDVLRRASPRIGPLMERLRNADEPVVDIPSSLSILGSADKMTLIAVPVHAKGKLAAALILSYDQKTTGAFLTNLIQLGVAIMVTMLFVATGLAALLVWLRFRDRLKASKTIQFLAHHDALTGLPNRTVFNTKLTEALRLAHAKASSISVILIDLDKFKDVNDTHGHAAGDLFLQVVADRMSTVFSRHLVARLSGDEFAVLLTAESDHASATRLAETMVAATKMPTRIDGKDIPVSVSMGIAQASDSAWRASRLLHCADLALYRAKQGGRSTFVWYTPDMDAEAKERRRLEHDLRKALRDDQFRLLYQPQFSLNDLKLTGYETLLRWEHPERGTISPAVFIPIAEEAGLIEEIGTWVLRRACIEAAAWEDSTLTVSVNVSPAQFKAGMTEQRVAEALRASGLDAKRLEIEITESLLISNTSAVVKTLTTVRGMGVSIAMDDFGTGYSSLSYLSRFPFDTIKIDRSFVATLGRNATTDAIIASIVGLGRSLGVTITAEGVENEDQAMLLRAAGCDKVQGFLFGRPLDLSDARASADALRRQEENRNFLQSRRASSVLLTPSTSRPTVETDGEVGFADPDMTADAGTGPAREPICADDPTGQEEPQASAETPDAIRLEDEAAKLPAGALLEQVGETHQEATGPSRKSGRSV